MYSPSGSPEPAPLHTDDPRTVGPYRLVGRLGAGGMGTVYAALDAAGTCVAVKMIKPDLAARAVYRETFIREVAVLRGLRVLCAPQMLNADATAEQPWVATEYVPGRTVSAHIREFGPLEGAALLAFAAGTAEALQALHESGVIHRDIKPGNVVLSPEGPRVLDFGIARWAQDHDSEERVYGTPGYLAPERLAGQRDSAAADVFAWGGLVAFAATGHAPFGAGDSSGVLERTRAGEHDLEGLPEEIASLVERALSPAPGQRPSAAECFRESLALGRETSAAPEEEETSDDRNRLAGLLGAVWRGFDNAGHDPRTWAALLGGAGVAGGVTAAATTSASTASMAGGTAAGASMTSTAATGSAAGLFTTKAMVLTAGGALTLAAVGGGGYFVSQAAAANERQETVEQAAQVLADGEGFSAEFTRQFTDERAEENAEIGDGSTAEILQATSTVLDVRYTRGEQPTFRTEITALEGEEIDAQDSRNEIVANVDGQIHAYGQPERHRDLWYNATDRFTADSYSVDTIVEPLRRLAGADDLAEGDTETIAGTETTRYSGSFLAPAVLGETVGEIDAVGDVWLDEAGNPVQLSYSISGWEISIEFTETDTPAEVEEPELEYSDSPAGPRRSMLVYTPACGEVTNADGTEFSVHADVWDMDCERTMTVASEFVDEGAGELMGDGIDWETQRFRIDDLLCVQGTHPDVDAPFPFACDPTLVDEDGTGDPVDPYTDIDRTWAITFFPTDPNVSIADVVPRGLWSSDPRSHFSAD